MTVYSLNKKFFQQQQKIRTKKFRTNNKEPKKYQNKQKTANFAEVAVLNLLT